MSRKTLDLTPQLQDYLHAHSLREHPVLAELREATAHEARGDADRARAGPVHGAARAADRARAAPSRSACSRATARSPWRSRCPTTGARGLRHQRGMDRDRAAATGKRPASTHKIDLRLAPALRDARLADRRGRRRGATTSPSSTRTRPATGLLRALPQLLRTGGLIAIDNTLWSGGSPIRAHDEDTRRCARSTTPCTATSAWRCRCCRSATA